MHSKFILEKVAAVILSTLRVAKKHDDAVLELCACIIDRICGISWDFRTHFLSGMDPAIVPQLRQNGFTLLLALTAPAHTPVVRVYAAATLRACLELPGALGLLNAAAQVENHKDEHSVLVRLATKYLLVEDEDDPDCMLRLFGARVLSHEAASSDSLKRAIVAEGGMVALVEMATCTDNETLRVDCLRALHNMCFLASIQVALCNEYLYRLLKLSWKCSPADAAMLSKVLQALSSNANNTTEMYTAELYI